MAKKTKLLITSVLALALTLSLTLAATLTFGKTDPVHAEGSLIYRLDFSDAENRGANSAGTEIEGATFYGNPTYTDNAVKGKTAINLPGGAVRTNYFTVPKETLDYETLTLAFWAKIPTDVTGWARMVEINNGYGGRGNLCALAMMPYAPNYYNGLYVYSVKHEAYYGNGTNENLVFQGADPTANGNTPKNPNILPVYDAWTHYAYELTPTAFKIYQNGYLIFEAAGEFAGNEYYSDSAMIAFGATVCSWFGDGDMKVSLADIRLYDYALDESQLKSEYALDYTDFLTTHYDFENGTTESVRGYNGTLENTASVINDAEKGNVLYIDGAQGGSDASTRSAMTVPLKTIAGHDRITISMDTYINSETASYTRLFEFAPFGGRKLEMYAKWGGSTTMLLKFSNCSETPRDKSVSVNGVFNRWMNITVSITNTTAKFYIDGYLVGENTVDFEYYNSTFWEYAGSMNFGRTLFWNDGPLTGMIDNIDIYSVALTEREVMKAHGIITVDDDAEAVASEKEKLTVDYTSGAARVELPAYAGEGVKLTWVSDNTDVLANDGTIVPPAFNTQVSLTATLTRGDVTMTKQFVLDIPAREVVDHSLYHGTALDEVTFEQGGYYDGLMRTNLDYMMSLDADRLLYNYRRIAGLDTLGAVGYGAWISSAGGGAGQFEAHLVLSLAKAAISVPDYSYNGETIEERMTYMLTEMAKCQKAYATAHPSEAGYFGAASIDQFYALKDGRKTTIDGENVWVPFYFMHKNLEMLIDVYDYAESDELKDTAYEMLVDFVDWIARFTAPIDTETRAKMLKTEYGGMSEALYQVYMMTGDVNHYKAAKFFEQTDLLDYIYDNVDVLNGLHANTTIPKFLAAAAAYEATGDEYYKTVAINAFDMVMTRIYAFGGTSRGEHWQKANDLFISNDTCETCCSYNMLKLADYLYRWTGDKKYADYFELTYTNHILASMAPDTGLKTYLTNTAFGYYKVYHTPDNSFWCCACTGMESFAKLNYGIYYRNDDTVRVNMFYPSTYTVNDDMAIEQTGDFYRTGKTALTINGAGAMTLALRLPDWADASKVTLRLNGEAMDISATDGYYNITREFADGDTIEYEVAMEFRLDLLKGSERTYALMYGPLVLVADLGNENVIDVQGSQLTFGTAYTGDIVGKTVLDGALSEAATVEMKDGGLYVTVKTLNQGELTFRPFNELFHDRYAMYFEYYDTLADLTADYIVEGNEYVNNFDEPSSLAGMTAYSVTGAGATVTDGQLVTMANTEFKLLYNVAVSAPYVAELTLSSATAGGAINAGLYVLASAPANGQDMIKAYNVQIEKATGESVYKISVFKFYSRYLGSVNSVSLSMPEDGVIRLHVTVKEDKVFVYVNGSTSSVLSFDIESDYAGEAAMVGIRSQFCSVKIDSFKLISAELSVGKTSLVGAMSIASTLSADDYTPATAAALAEKLAAATAVYADENATQAEVNAADYALREAVAALVLRGDVTLIKNAYATFRGLDAALFTEESAAELKTVLDKIAALQEGASKAEVEALEDELKTVLMSLELNENYEAPTDSSGKKKGCNSAVPGAMGALAIASLVAALALKKKREE